MSYTYRGVELVNCGPPKQRKGPLEKFTFGKYVGCRVEDIIRRDPNYFMWAVKEWLDVSPQQAFLFETVTGGGIIPDSYISERREKKVASALVGGEDRDSPPRPERSPFDHSKNRKWYEENDFPDWPNYDFDPSIAPEWWEEFKSKIKDLCLDEANALYRDYQRKEIHKLMEYWNKEYDEYRKTRSQK